MEFDTVSVGFDASSLTCVLSRQIMRDAEKILARSEPIMFDGCTLEFFGELKLVISKFEQPRKCYGGNVALYQ